MTAGSIVARARWKWLYHEGEEAATLASKRDGWRFEGRVKSRFPEGPAVVRYAIDCDRGWRTRAVHIEFSLRKVHRDLWVEADDAGRWQVGGMEQEDLRGCVDVDLAATPVTNTLPIRRLDLPVGGSAEILAAWMTFPDLHVAPVRQRYTRLADRRYRYEAPFNRFTSEFDVDDEGLVLTYPGFWERTAGSAGIDGRRRARA